MEQLTILHLIGGMAVALVLGAAMGVLASMLLGRLHSNKEVKKAQAEAERIVEEARKNAEIQKKQALLDAKDEWFKAKQVFEKETSKVREEIDHSRNEVKEKDSEIVKKLDQVNKREKEFLSREAFLNSREKTIRIKDQELTALIKQQNDRLENISGMSQDEARKILLENLDADVRHEAAQMIKEIKDKAKEQAEREAKEIIVQAIQRSAADTTVDATVSVVSLPGDEMKGRIIGREGRNIRAFEEATGVDVIVDDTPEAVILSGFDPIRREVARMALEKLVQDGRIHPGRIEEVVQSCEKEIEKIIKETGEQTIFDIGVHGLHPELVRMIGRLRYRTSYGQNVLQHSKEVAVIAELMAAELGLDKKIARRAGLLHDVGKAIDRETEGTHSELGANLAKKYGESDVVVNAIAAHHEDVAPISLFPILMQAADTISSTRPGARRETLTTYIKRLEKLEEIADSFRGVEKAFAIQAGREVRVMVQPDQMSDAQSQELATQLAQRIQGEMEYPGQIKITVIREIRAVDFAR